jgi:hypothetical protein
VVISASHHALTDFFLQFDERYALLNHQRYIRDLSASYMVEVQASDVIVLATLFNTRIVGFVLGYIRLKNCTPF